MLYILDTEMLMLY